MKNIIDIYRESEKQEKKILLLKSKIQLARGIKNKEIESFVSKICFEEDMEISISYDEIIFLNAQYGFMFTCSTDEDVIPFEKRFYEIHFEIEAMLTPIVDKILDKSFIALEKEIIPVLDQVSVLLKGITEEVPPAAFELFRDFLIGYPEKGIHGPSGAYSPTLAIIQFLAIEKRIDRMAYANHVTKNLLFFPKNYRAKILASMKQEDLADRALYITLRKFKNEFGKTHMKIVRKYLSLSMIGTGGQPINRFLGDRIKETKCPYH